MPTVTRIDVARCRTSEQACEQLLDFRLILFGSLLEPGNGEAVGNTSCNREAAGLQLLMDLQLKIHGILQTPGSYAIANQGLPSIV